MRFVHIIFCVKSNRVYFNSFDGAAYCDNPKALCNAIHCRWGDQLEYVWLFNNGINIDNVPSFVKKRRRTIWRVLYYMCTSKVWIMNTAVPHGTYKSKKQIYIQTWHGDCAFKKILGDVPYNPVIYEESNILDLLVVGSDYGKKVISHAFGFLGEVMATGCPRNDIFFQENSAICESIREKYGLTSHHKILMYAPTFRRKFRNQVQHVGLDLEKVLEILRSKGTDDWKILVRSHIANSVKGLDVERSSDIIDVTAYPDMNELLLITDILITDYSSSAGDFALTGRLVLLYQDDLKEYTDEDRSLYFSQSPFIISYTPDEFYTKLLNRNEIDIKRNCEDILSFLETHEKGEGALSVVKYISDVLK